MCLQDKVDKEGESGIRNYNFNFLTIFSNNYNTINTFIFNYLTQNIIIYSKYKLTDDYFMLCLLSMDKLLGTKL